MSKHPVSVIVTVYNEANTVLALLDALAQQTVLPDEVIITDAASSDDTVKKIEAYDAPFMLRVLRLSHVSRSEGRNIGVTEAQNNHILLTDAGCIPDIHWVACMTEGFAKADVVAGIAHPQSDTIFERCVAPYVLVMPDRVDPTTYLPATRSMGITKQLWMQLGGLDPHHTVGEDYAFSRKLQALQIPIAVQPSAIVFWRPRQSLTAFASMTYALAFADMHNGSFRVKILTIYARYCLLVLSWLIFWPLGAGLFFLYLLYAVRKSYRYVGHWKAVVYLPVLQVVSDCCVMAGTLLGALRPLLPISR